jgi:ABC-2 type transport system ATP-binding protein
VLGLHRATAGWVKCFGQRMTPNSADLRRRIGYIPTNPQFPQHMTPITYLDYMARLFGLPLEVRKPRLASLIRAVDLLGSSGDKIAGFSNGMSARLAVATSLINEPDLLIWDEPTHGLDPEARRSMLELIKNLSREKTLVLSSHNLSDIDEVCNHAAVLSRGQLIYFGSLQDLKGRMRRNHFEVDLDGDQKSITKAVASIKQMTEFKSVALKQRRLELHLADEQNNASALANVFMTLSDGKVNIMGIRTVGQQTEQAFLDLVEKEESKGFARLYQSKEAA